MIKLLGLFAIFMFFISARAEVASQPAPILRQIPYRVTVVDPNNALGEQKDLILANLDAAILDWSRYVSSRGELWIEIKVTETTSTGRFTGGSTSVKFLKEQNGYRIFEHSGTYKMRTGHAVDPNKPDIQIEIQPEFMRAQYWIDPLPSTRMTPVGAAKVDLVTVFAHELGHGMGIEGWLNTQTGAFPADKIISVYDSYIAIGADRLPVFTGPITVATNVVPAAVAFFSTPASGIAMNFENKTFLVTQNPQQNIYHLGRFMTTAPDTDLSFFSLMAASWQGKKSFGVNGRRIIVSPLDAAVLEDIGVPPAPRP